MTRYNTFFSSGEQGLADQLLQLHADVSAYLAAEREAGRQLVFTKVFLSDIQNQQAVLESSSLFTDIIGRAAWSVVQQAPANHSKAALLVRTEERPSFLKFDSLRLTEDEARGKDSYEQTLLLFAKYIEKAGKAGLTLERHCVRTWIYVRDIDNNYASVVRARNHVFEAHGLTAQTHFIASTGIGGQSKTPNALVAMDFLTNPEATDTSLRYLHALDFLNYTQEYGVAFERGAMLTHEGHDTFFISGTASIDKKGQVLYEGDVRKQTERLLQNIEALLADGGSSLSDVLYFIVYLRDTADYATVEAYMNRRFPHVPHIITHAYVCRPSWLIEMECMAEAH